jgi:hypothetical protein
MGGDWVLRGVGYLTRTLVYLGLALWLWSFVPDIAQRPIGSLTVEEVVRVLSFLFLALGLCWCLFHPKNRDPLSVWYFNYWETWGGLGLALVAIALGLVAWFSRDGIRAWIHSWAVPVGDALDTFSKTGIGEWLGTILFLGVIVALQIFLIGIVWAYVRSIYGWAAAKVVRRSIGTTLEETHQEPRPSRSPRSNNPVE